MKPSPSSEPTHVQAHNPFFATPQQRVALARRRYFEEGVRPSGLVSEAVIQSWQRCLQARHDPARTPGFNEVTASRAHSVMSRCRQLVEAAHGELDQLRATLAGTSGTAILTDAQGVVVATTFSRARPEEIMLPLGARVGVNLAEEAVGTTAPGITARTGQASVVQGCEHFFGPVGVMYCAAAPIRDVKGRLAGVLDLSSEHVPFNFDVASVVGLYANAIENRLLCAQAVDHLVLRFQISPALLDTPMAALIGLSRDGRVAWLNGTAARLLGVATPPPDAPAADCAELLGQTAESLLGLTRRPGPSPVQLPNGLMVWMRAELKARDGARQVHAVTPAALAPAAAVAAAEPPIDTPAAATLRELDRHLIARTLKACGGNVSKAARQLGVSRGLVYRHLKPQAA